MTGLISKALNEYAGVTSRVWQTDRSQTVGASEVGQCARKVFWLKNEGDAAHAASRDPDYTDGWGARARGTIYENNFWEPALRMRFGPRLKFAGQEQRTFVSGFLSATPDGLLIDMQPDQVAPGSGEHITVECKTADPRTNLTEAKAENVYQTHVQMGLIRELTPYQPTHSILSYTDASFWNEVREFVIAFDPAVFAAAKARAATIMTATHASELKPEGWIAGGRECEYCPFTRACGIQRRNVPDKNSDADPQFVAEISDLVRTLRSLEKARDANETRLREIQQNIRDRLREKGVRKLPGLLTWSAVKGRPSYDNKGIREAAIAAGVDVERFATVGEPTDRLQITLNSDRDLAADNPRAAASAAA
jgi:hypothetical protein